MNITKDTAVTLNYKITDPVTGKPLDSGDVAYLHGGYENIFPKVEAALEGRRVVPRIDDVVAADVEGDKIRLEPELRQERQLVPHDVVAGGARHRQVRHDDLAPRRGAETLGDQGDVPAPDRAGPNTLRGGIPERDVAQGLDP